MSKGFGSLNGSAVPVGMDGPRVKNGELKGSQYVTTGSQAPRQRPSSMVSINATSRSHQRRWSADFSEISSVITVKKNVKEPQPPQRTVSLLRLQRTSRSSLKRYSCPPIGISQSQSSSSSSSTTSSCSSPPPVPTSLIIGHDPLGWRLQPKSSSSSSWRRAKRPSLQSSLPVIPTQSSPSTEASSKSKPALRPKPSRRHSEPSASLRLHRKSLPVVSPEELCAARLQLITLSDKSDDVFTEATPDQRRATAPRRKIPPPVPVKTAKARQTAHLIAASRQSYRPVTTKPDKDRRKNPAVIDPERSRQSEASHHTSYKKSCVSKAAATRRGAPDASPAEE